MVETIEKLIRVRIEQVGKGIKKTTEDLDKQGKVLKRTISVTKDLRRRFQAWALSMLFFGMAIKRFFDGIYKSSTQTFIKIMESSGYAGTAIQQLNAHFEYLKFTVGSVIDQVLMRFLPMIISIVEKIAHWVREHPKLTSALIIFGIVIGTLIMLFGIMFLGINGLIDLMIHFGFVTTTSSGAVTGLGAALVSGIAWAVIFGFFLYLLARFKSVGSAVAWVAAKINRFAKWITEKIIDLGLFIFTSLEKVYGFLDKFGIKVKYMFIALFTLIYIKLGEFVNKSIDALNVLIDEWNRIPGVNIGRIGFKIETEGLMDTVREMGAAELALRDATTAYRIKVLEDQARLSKEAYGIGFDETYAALMEKALSGQRDWANALYGDGTSDIKNGGTEASQGQNVTNNITINALGTNRETIDQLADEIKYAAQTNSNAFSSAGVS